MKKLKRNLLTIFFALVFLVGLGIFAYPSVSDLWNRYRQSKLISQYESAVNSLPEETYEEEWEKAREYNKGFGQNSFDHDAFAGETEELEGTEYWNLLNLSGDGVMGVLVIPKIGQTIPIYHGTASEVLEAGTGHLAGTALPIGGAGTHCVLAAHRGLPSSKLFTDLDQIEVGDRWYVKILNETIGYEADRILPMVDANDLDALTSAMQVEDGQDYMTLLTCTPYGGNTHRLLVRGHRVEVEKEEVEEVTDLTEESGEVLWVTLYRVAIPVTSFAILLIAIFALRGSKKNKNKRESSKGFLKKNFSRWLPYHRPAVFR